MSDLGRIALERNQGNEPFHDRGRPLGYDLLSFWRWGLSDVISNTTRGVLAEYLVASAVGVSDGVREEWAPYDLKAPDGTTIEVKSSAFIQRWRQPKLSTISFLVAKRRAWYEETGEYDAEPRRHADVYVFALLAHKDQETLDPLDLSQWEFYVLPTVVLDQRKRSQHSITLPSLRKLAGEDVGYVGLKKAVERAAFRQKGAAG